ncbi:hypothetical protein U0070_015816 [Myodes glareolus]|uniref:Centromere protein I n=1 Tax=Myodes glareolus TaxID=447135 RepID=A0AAW0HCP4_MYOGA
MIYFNNSKNLWTSALVAVKLRNQRAFPEPPKLTLGPTKDCSLKRKWSSPSVIPALNSANKDCGEKTLSLSDYFSGSRSFPLEELQSFPHLLQNIHCLELPSQMSSVLNNSLLLHYINCVKDESILLRLYYWLSQALQEECIWYNMNNYEQEKEFVNLLDIVIRVQCFLQCSLLQSLKELLQNWLLWLSMDAHVQPLTSSPLETTLGETMTSLVQLIEYVGWLSLTALRLESNNTLLLHFILDFFEKVCDIYVNYDLPLLVLFPPVIFHSALLSLDASILNQLCYIMYRYHNNLTAAKKNNVLKKAKSEFNLSSKICQEFNYYLTAMVRCLWMSKPFDKGMYVDPQSLENSGVTEYKYSLNLVQHPSLLSYAASFLLQVSVFKVSLDFIGNTDCENRNCLYLNCKACSEVLVLTKFW